MLDSRRMAELHAEGFAIGWDAAEFEQMMLEQAVADVLVSQALVGHVVTGFIISRVVLDEAELLSIALDREVRVWASPPPFWNAIWRIWRKPARNPCSWKWLPTMHLLWRCIAVPALQRSADVAAITPARPAAPAAMP